jgi:hypothetical protein
MIRRKNGTLASTLTPQTTEPIWLTHAEHPLQYNKADFSEPSNQIVKEHRGAQPAACAGRYSNRIHSEVNAPDTEICELGETVFKCMPHRELGTFFAISPCCKPGQVPSTLESSNQHKK